MCVGKTYNTPHARALYSLVRDEQRTRTLLCLSGFGAKRDIGRSVLLAHETRDERVRVCWENIQHTSRVRALQSSCDEPENKRMSDCCLRNTRWLVDIEGVANTTRTCAE